MYSKTASFSPTYMLLLLTQAPIIVVWFDGIIIVVWFDGIIIVYYYYLLIMYCSIAFFVLFCIVWWPGMAINVSV